MPTLREIQTAFAAALLDDVVEPAALRIVARSGEAGSGLSVYRNNVCEGFRKTLALEFPVIERLVGSDYFRQLARDYQREHPSRSGDLQFIGVPFASFLELKFSNTEFNYLPDIARLEWLCEELAIAAHDGVAELTDFGGLDPDLYPSLRLEFRSDRALLASAFPILKIWRSNQPGAAFENIDLAEGGDWLLALRGKSGSELISLQAAEYHFAKSLRAGTTLSQALQRAMAMDPSFDVSAALLGLFQHQAIRRLVVSPSHISN